VKTDNGRCFSGPAQDNWVKADESSKNEDNWVKADESSKNERYYSESAVE